MSVTITIKNNHQYCKTHNLVTKSQLPCQCAGYENGLRTLGDEACSECGGEGYTQIDEYPFELNIANANFKTLWNALGLECRAAEMGFLGATVVESSDGEIDSRRILKALKCFSGELLVRGTVTNANHIYCGINPEQAARYIFELGKIAMEAARREEKIVWG